MRILAIRGKNLASLYGPFELRLDGGPIGDAGLFSIAGPTGSGKSTIVDALCLALYGRTPRLGERSRGVRVGRAGPDAGEQVDADDERGILSHGTAEAVAEVEFEGIDGRRWRAQWSVKRAHGKPGGKLQAARMALWDGATGEAVTDRVSEVPAEVRARIGFDFGEFRRAVVLPQFQFRAFLEAKPDERAAILEKVTGVDVYSRLSRAAHERAAQAAEKLRTLAAQAEVIAVLDDEQRGALAEARSRGEADAEHAAGRARAAEDALRWYARAAELDAELAQARSRCDTAEEAARGAEALRRELAEVAVVEPLRTLHAEAARTAADARGAEARLAEDGEAFAAAQAASAAAAAIAASAQAKHAGAARVRTEAEPELRRARMLDQALAAEATRADGAAREREAAAAAAAAARMARDRLAGEHRAAGERRDGAQAWLAAHAHEAALAAEWPRWREQLGAHAVASRDLSRALAVLAAGGVRLADDDGLLPALDREATRASAEAASAAAHAAARGEAAQAFSPQLLRDDAVAARARREALQELQALAAEVARAEADALAAAGARDRERAAASEAGTRRDALVAAYRAAKAAEDEARDALGRVSAALQLEGRRGSLVDGKPCPLCGALEHPWAAEGAPGAELLRAQQAAVDAAAARTGAMKEDGGRARADAEGATRRAEAHARTAAEREEAAREAARRYLAARRLDDAPADPRAPDALGALEALLHAGREASAAAETRLATALRAAEEARLAVEESDAVRARSETVRDALDIARTRERIEAGLAPALDAMPGWRGAARALPEELARACEAVAAAHAGHERTRADALDTLAELAPRLATAEAHADRSARDAEHSAALARDATAALEAAHAARAQVLEGAAAEEVEHRLDGALRDAAAAAEGASRARSEAAERLAAATRAREIAARELEQKRRAHAAAADTLRTAREERGVDAARLEELLGRGPRWAEETRRALVAIDRAVHEARVLLEERRGRRAAHDVAGRPATTCDEARATCDAAKDLHGRATAAAKEAELRLRQDDDARAARARAGEVVEEQRAIATRWQALSELIGSADGKKFRVFAQGLALDALLAQANRHLEELARRYRLARAPGSDLDLQVIDRDLGDEPRSVNGLSGGESFLVSLALALGLSSLSGSGATSRTLLIDEGFGTLDRDTLEHAMFALESLRATGRTVGVISHVPELHDRIGVQVTIQKVSATRSRVVVPA